MIKIPENVPDYSTISNLISAWIPDTAEGQAVVGSFLKGYNQMSSKINQASRIHDAPKWLIFKDIIINTSHIMSIEVDDTNPNEIVIACREGKVYHVPVTNKEDLWKKLQKVFTWGVDIDDNPKQDDVSNPV